MTASAPDTAAKPARAFKLDLKTVGPLLALAMLILLGITLNENFLTYNNLTNVLARSSFIGIIAIGATFVITSGGLDLSVGSMAAVIAGVMIMVMNWLIPTMGIFRSLVTFLADGGTLSLNFEVADVYRPVYYDGLLGVPWPIIVFALVAIGGEIVMRYTAFGRYCAAIGSNEQVARYSSINVDNVRLLTYILQGVLVGVAVLLYVPRLGSASSTTGVLWELEAIAGVIIGGTTLKGGYGRIWGTVVGVVILGLIGNILNLQSLISPYLNGAFQGVIIILAVLLQRGRRTS